MSMLVYEAYKEKDVLDDLYWSRKLSAREIATRFDVSDTTIRKWMKKRGIRRRPHGRIEPNLKPTQALCYILGVIKGDGSVYHTNRDWKVRLYTPNKTFIQSFIKALKKIGLHPHLNGPYKHSENRQPAWVVVAHSIIFFRWYKSLAMKALEQMLLQKKPHIIAFLKGFYESEGYGRLKPPMIDITNTDNELVNLTEKLLKTLDFHPHVYTHNYNDGVRKKRYQIRLYRQEEVTRFLQLLKPYIKNPLKGVY